MKELKYVIGKKSYIEIGGCPAEMCVPSDAYDKCGENNINNLRSCKSLKPL